MADKRHGAPNQIVMCVDCRKVRSVFTAAEERWERRPDLYSAPQPMVSYTLCPECASLSVPRPALPRHQCLIYDGSPTAQLSPLAFTARHKLKTGHRCLFLNSPTMVDGFRSHLEFAGVDVAGEVKRGALVLSSDQSHLEDGQFDVDQMLASLKDELAAALSGGYAGLWATGDMKWEFGHERNFDKLLEYECRLEEFLRKNPKMSGVCQYHRDVLPAIAVEVARSTHGFINETLRRLYPIARTFSAGGAVSARVQALFDGLNHQDAPLE